MASAVYPAKVALKALLAAHTWPTTTPEVAWGQPVEGDDQPQGLEVIHFGDTEQLDDEFYVLGAARLDEKFALRIIIDVRQYGDDEQATEARAWQLRDEIVALLRANMTLSGAINRITGFRITNTNVPAPSQWRTVIAIDAACVAYEQF